MRHGKADSFIAYIMAGVMTTAAILGVPYRVSATGGASAGVSTHPWDGNGETDSQYDPDTGSDELLDIVHEAVTYEDYLSRHDISIRPETEVTVTGASGVTVSDDAADTESFTDSSGQEGFVIVGDALDTPEEGTVSYEIDVPQAGYYQIRLGYEPLPGKNSRIERILRLNGEIPFENAQYLTFSRCWQDAEEIRRDSRNNDVRPAQEEIWDWMEAWLTDSDGYYTEPFLFWFEEGINTISFEAVREPVRIGTVTLAQKSRVPSYEEYAAESERLGFREAGTGMIRIQGEDAAYKSDSTLYPIPDRSSPLTEPYDASKTRLNEIGGSNWKTVGQWISWEADVPEDGLYELALRCRQNINAGQTVIRSLMIDGELPFTEAGCIPFHYNSDWQMLRIGGVDGPYKFRLTEGRHEIRLQITLGDELSEILRRTDSSISELNRAYRQLLMVIGPTADTLRDYQLTAKAPEALRIIAQQYDETKTIRDMAVAYSQGSAGSSLATLENLVNQLYRMTDDPRTIARQWSAFKDNIVSLGSWALTMKEQPLDIDYWIICAPGTELPKADAGFLAKAAHEAKQFAASFYEDYDSIGEVYDGMEAIDVWILADGTNVTSMTGGGRDQATVIKQLVDNYFVPETGIPVNVRLVNKDVLLSATLAGFGPDVALNAAGKEPINYALRNAVADLTEFSDFEEVKSWFHEDALTQFTFNDAVYALPQTMSFHVLFYRADILKELGLTVPRTWDEFYEALAVIQKNNMNIGIFPDYTTFAMFLYQHGGSYYTEDKEASGLDTEEAIDAFKQWSGNYVNYRMPVTFDFANRFRTGEMPLAIGDYTNYNYLSVFAPEIRGLWGFTTVPGYERKDGSYSHTVSTWETAVIMMETSDHKDQAWEFMKWWMSAKTQSDYGNEIENVLGVAGRVATANLEALSNLPWSNRDYRQLTKQLAEVKAIPEIPGSYYTERNIKNAFYTVYNNNEDPRETLQDIVKTINTEIDAKREEFGLHVRGK